MLEYHWRLLSIVLLFHILPAGTSAADRDPLLLAIGHRSEISLIRYAAEGDTLFIWLPGEHGLQESEVNTVALNPVTWA